MRKISLSLLLGVLIAASVCQAQDAPGKRPMTFDDMMAMKRLGETAVSPDGKWLAYSVTTVNLEQNTKTAELFIQPIAGGDAKPLIVAQPGDSGPQFSPDGKRILFLSSRDGNKQQVYMADFDAATGATANPKRVTFLWTEADNARWSPDGKFIVFTSAVYPDCPAIKPDDFASGDTCNINRDEGLDKSKVKAQIFTHLLYRHWDHYTGEKRSHLFQVLLDVPPEVRFPERDLTPNDPHDVPPFSLEGGGGFDVSPDSKEMAFTENLDPEPATSVSAKILTLDLTNPAAKPVVVSNSAGGNFNPAYSPDGKYLAWRSEARAGYESDKFRLMIYDRAEKTIKNLLPKFDNWVDEFVWGPANSHAIYFTSGEKGEESIFAFDQLESAFHREPNSRAPALRLTKSGEYGELHPVYDGKLLIATRMTVAAPGEAVALDSEFIGHALRSMATSAGVSTPEVIDELKKESPVTRLNDALLSQLDLPKMEDFWFEAADKTKVQGFIIKPPAFDPAKKYPVKFLIHGGPQGAWGDSWSYRWNPELFAANGYVVVMINPRGSTGYGQAFVDGVNGDWGGKPFTDLMTGLDYAEEHYSFIDKSRECALGASYGGYMANWILGHTNRFKCIVSHDGMFNAESAFGTTEEDWFNIWEFKGHPWDYYGKPDSENPFRKWSPSLSAKNFKTPTLVIHGQLDYRLDVSEGFQLFDTLQLLKVPSKMLYFPDEGHWVLKPQNSQLWYKTVNDWVDEWTKPGNKE
jgi:dipeptidyl aminopeptidase/acylaminoacyl peptidase